MLSHAEELVDGPRACQAWEIPQALDFTGVGTVLPHFVTEANREQVTIVKVNGQLVAHAGLWVWELTTSRGLLRMGGLGGVSCHPDFRRRGLGEACVRRAMDRMRELGCQIGWLWTVIGDWYRRLDWEHCGRGWSFSVDRANAALLPALPPGVEVGESLWPDLEAMLALHDRHPLRAARTPELFRCLAERPGWSACTASSGGELLAYLLLREGDAMEYAGDPVLAAGLIRDRVMRQDDPGLPTSTTSGRGQLSVDTPEADGLAALLAARGLPQGWRDKQMIWIADLPGLLGALSLAEEIRAQETAQGVRLTRGGQQVELSRRELVKLLFGPERVSDFAADLLPVDWYHWRLDWA